MKTFILGIFLKHLTNLFIVNFIGVGLKVPYKLHGILEGQKQHVSGRNTDSVFFIHL